MLAFSVPMPGRQFNANSYKYGFNGMEKDDEVSGTGNSYTAMDWQYDSRLGRRWNVDPLTKKYPRRGQWWSPDKLSYKYPNISPYAFALNNPIYYIDKDGNIVVDMNGNPVTVSVSKDKEGNYAATYKFADNTSQEAKDQFYANAGKLIEPLIQTKTGRSLVKDANSSKHKVHILLVEKEKVYNGDGVSEAPFGITIMPGDELNPVSNKENMNDVWSIEVFDGNIKSTQKQVEAGAEAGDQITIAGEKVALSEKRADLVTTSKTEKEQRSATAGHEIKHFLLKNRRGEGPSDRTHKKIQKEFSEQKKN